LDKRTWLLVILASLMMGASNVYSKIAYENLSFITAFVWLRWCCFAVALVFVTLTSSWRKIFMKERSEKKLAPTKSAFKVMIIGQLSGSLGVVLLQVAIKLGNVILVTALNGLQFFFVIYLVYLLSKFFPKIIKEDIKRHYLWQKAFLSLVMVVGVVLIFI
jgi:drug/metabolite transporter (DMT)-like permease